MNMENRAIGQEEDVTAVATGGSATECYKKLMKMAENAEQAKRTNFEAITESPEKLAKFIEDVTLICYGCKVVFAENCPHRKRNGVMFCDKEECAKWLNEESIE